MDLVTGLKLFGIVSYCMAALAYNYRYLTPRKMVFSFDIESDNGMQWVSVSSRQNFMTAMRLGSESSTK